MLASIAGSELTLTAGEKQIQELNTKRVEVKTLLESSRDATFTSGPEQVTSIRKREVIEFTFQTFASNRRIDPLDKKTLEAHKEHIRKVFCDLKKFTDLKVELKGETRPKEMGKLYQHGFFWDLTVGSTDSTLLHELRKTLRNKEITSEPNTTHLKNLLEDICKFAHFAPDHVNSNEYESDEEEREAERKEEKPKKPQSEEDSEHPTSTEPSTKPKLAYKQEWRRQIHFSSNHKVEEVFFLGPKELQDSNPHMPGPVTVVDKPSEQYICTAYSQNSDMEQIGSELGSTPFTNDNFIGSHKFPINSWELTAFNKSKLCKVLPCKLSINSNPEREALICFFLDKPPEIFLSRGSTTSNEVERCNLKTNNSALAKYWGRFNN